MIIRNINNNDIPSILALNEISVAVLSPLDESKLLRLINTANVACTIEVETQVAGFILAFGPNCEYDSINYQWFNQHYQSFLYIDRIVIGEAYRGQGLASQMYKRLIKQAQNSQCINLLAEIDIMPPNEASLLFHQKFGFIEVSKLEHNKNKIVSLQALAL